MCEIQHCDVYMCGYSCNCVHYTCDVCDVCVHDCLCACQHIGVIVVSYCEYMLQTCIHTHECIISVLCDVYCVYGCVHACRYV